MESTKIVPSLNWLHTNQHSCLRLGHLSGLGILLLRWRWLGRPGRDNSIRHKVVHARPPTMPRWLVKAESYPRIFREKEKSRCCFWVNSKRKVRVLFQFRLRFSVNILGLKREWKAGGWLDFLLSCWSFFRFGFGRGFGCCLFRPVQWKEKEIEIV